MEVKNYLKEAFRLTSLIFTTLISINLILQNDVAHDVLEVMLLISAVSGSLHFLLDDNGKYSDRRLIINQVLYLLIIFFQIALGDILLHWELGVSGLLLNYLIVLIIYVFIRSVMYSKDKREADKINQFIQKRNRDKS
ncbi:DUF3021 family protein [Enterococcus sp. BWM-S5]|uniref:DUF3021 family protein n=1 Tax=Enterococcus larvae TaxID=2794352 RepID=A0ABS4CI54_9ENTE|nr:DUF3021 family protein [Enterococcus larvae]MBP1046262.1 DUF3021 family protein [Enterococcus larvae]